VPPELNAAAAFAIAAVATYLATPVAIAIAVRTRFLDLPAGYKGHRRPTPYLGGTAIIVGILAAVLLVRGAGSTHWAIIAGALAIWAMGTADDRISLPISVRMLAEAGIAVMLWSTGRGWTVFHNGPADLALTVFWVVGVMNAFNLMDNMDGAAASTAAVSAIGAGVLALLSGDLALAPLSFAVAGACFGFLPRNLARPARIFMGDGGSLLLGLLVARVTMAAVTRSYLGPSGVIVAALLVGMVILDTTLVTISRSRAGRSVLSGGRDHLTHRLSHRLGAPRRVALTLAATQLVVSAVTIGVARAGAGWVLMAGTLALVFAGVLIWQLESSPLFKGAPAEAQAPALVPELSALRPQLAPTAPMSVARVRGEGVHVHSTIRASVARPPGGDALRD
jgi:UDP-GlcNAc:undecaprenyl-phosphate/decaprenyl-phosphate GlcNAc-1-phosphate transferase